MQKRQNALHEWLKEYFSTEDFKLEPLAGDASFRRYFRLLYANNTYVLMDAPPEKEAILPFIQLAHALAKAGVRCPSILAENIEWGFILLEDFGDALFLNCLQPERVDALYQAAFHSLIQIQKCATDDPKLPAFDKSHMLKEMSLFQEWFLERYLTIPLSHEELELIQESENWIADQISQQPTVFIHRDYHSRNLMVLEKTSRVELGVIDFQDAMLGPFSYDLVSLLKDCYVQWPDSRIQAWLSNFYQLMPNHFGWSLEAFNQGFELCGIQRHLKVLGIFCRLNFRDQKPTYLKDLPLTLQYLSKALGKQDKLGRFSQLIQQKISPKFLEKQNLCSTL